MKIKSLFAFFLALTLLTCTFVMPASAKENTTNNEFEIIINEDVSEETKEKIEKYFANGEPTINNCNSTYGITCTLLGHKLENTSVSTITHKVRASAPRCVRKTYAYQECTRCDYETSELVATEYIFCCS